MSDQYTSDSGGRSLEQVAAELRARVASSHYPLGSFLPSQRELAEEFGVSRDIVQRALRKLRSEGWIETQQGSGSRVIRAQRTHAPGDAEEHDSVVTLGSLINRAFEQPEVTLDVMTLTPQFMTKHIQVQAERIRAGEIAPQHIALRMLLPHESDNLAYPWFENAPDKETLGKWAHRSTRQHTMRMVLSNLEIMRLVSSVDFEDRTLQMLPTCKLYLINRVEAVLGQYKLVPRPVERDDGHESEVIDVPGLDNKLFRYAKDDDPHSHGTTFVETMQEWFDSAWRHSH
ncbi:winged helix-turn-helix domain-containing protein [Streptomyces bobili]|uniref:winged helix-turn-helix domain-containing protein n=1 Tax=Streptomyces bobili TaxID=67280 RepID=UPI0036F7B122